MNGYFLGKSFFCRNENSALKTALRDVTDKASVDVMEISRNADRLLFALDEQTHRYGVYMSGLEEMIKDLSHKIDSLQIKLHRFNNLVKTFF